MAVLAGETIRAIAVEAVHKAHASRVVLAKVLGALVNDDLAVLAGIALQAVATIIVSP